MPIDFSQLSGEDFEFFCRDLLESLGSQILEGPARGPDSKKDLIIQYKIKDVIGREEQYKVLVQCKNNAKSQKSVYESDLGDIRSACKIHNTKGYLLITSTIPSVSAQNILKAINEEGHYFTHYWDKYILEKFISKSKEGLRILDRYGLIQSEYKIYDFTALARSEFEILNKINEEIGFNIEVVKDYGEQLNYPNSCYIYLGHIINLNIENLKNTNLDELLEYLDIFQELENLVLRDTNLNSFPKAILKLENLYLLVIGENNITSIPKEISKLKKLTQLDISYNPLKEFNVDIEFLNHLEFFLIDRDQLIILENKFEQLLEKNYRIDDFTISGFNDEENRNFFKKYGF